MNKMNIESHFIIIPSAIWHAMYFDGSSGGVCRVGVITKDGIDREVLDSFSLN